MADLEKLLLEAAGRTSGGRNQQSAPSSRRRLQGSYSDKGSEPKEDDTDDEHDYGGRKPSGAHVPLKKRPEPSDSGNDSGSLDGAGGGGGGDDSADDSDIGSDLFKNEHDREALYKMTELEREMILLERAVKKDDKNFQEVVRTKLGSEKKTRKEVMTTAHIISSHGVRSSARSADRAASKDDALNELREKRMKQHDTAGRGGRGLSPPVKQKEFGSMSPSSSSQRDSDSGSHSEDEDVAEDGGSADSEEEDEKTSSEVLTFDDVKGITVRRSKLAKWFMEPFFENLIAGCLVRVGVGKSKDKPVYKICMVRSVDALGREKSYKLETWTTSKYLHCVYGNEKPELWQMAMVSDKEPLEDEFQRWLKAAESRGSWIPGKKEVLEKADAIQKTNSFVYSPDSVKKMLKMKKSASLRPMNVAAEKDRLRREMGVAESRQDGAEVERIKARLKELDASRKAEQKDSKAVRLAEMNKRNRAENYKTASGLKPSGMGLKAGEEGYDPFSRRWTRSMNYYMSKLEGTVEAQTADVDTAVELAAVGAGEGADATAAALEAAADAGKLVDTSAPVDQGTESYTLHDFPLPISLAALQRLGGPQGGPAGFMARKQRQEAVVGFKVPVNDGQRHTLTLTVSDYKRRRGLL